MKFKKTSTNHGKKGKGKAKAMFKESSTDSEVSNSEDVRLGSTAP